MDRITPFISPTYSSWRPKSVRSVMTGDVLMREISCPWSVGVLGYWSTGTRSENTFVFFS
jgi:hypothetical protein